MSVHLVPASLVVEGTDLPALARLVVAGLQRRVETGHPLDAREREVARQFLDAARAWQVPAASDPPSDGPSDVDSRVSVAGAWLSTADAAEQLGTSTRAVIDAIGRGALVARRRSRREWEVDEHSVQRYAQTRRRPGRQ